MHKKSLFFFFFFFLFSDDDHYSQQKCWLTATGRFLQNLWLVMPIWPPHVRSLLSLFFFFSSNSSGSKHATNKLNRLAKGVSGLPCRTNLEPTLGTHQISKFFFSSQRSFSREKFTLVGYIITQSVLVTTKQDFKKLFPVVCCAVFLFLNTRTEVFLIRMVS